MHGAFHWYIGKLHRSWQIGLFTILLDGSFNWYLIKVQFCQFSRQGFILSCCTVPSIVLFFSGHVPSIYILFIYGCHRVHWVLLYLWSNDSYILQNIIQVMPTIVQTTRAKRLLLDEISDLFDQKIICWPSRCIWQALPLK